jgi:hypothetical protein
MAEKQSDADKAEIDMGTSCENTKHARDAAASVAVDAA